MQPLDDANVEMRVAMFTSDGLTAPAYARRNTPAAGGIIGPEDTRRVMTHPPAAP